MVNCWVLLPEQWWQTDAAGRLLSSSQQAPTALWPEYLASLHLALSFVRLIHQQDFTQPVETADTRRQCSSPGEGWGCSAGDTQSASHTGISAEPTCPGASAVPDLCMSGLKWGLKKVFKVGVSSRLEISSTSPQSLSSLLMTFIFFWIYISSPPAPRPRNCGTSQQFCPAILSLPCRVFLYLLLYLFLYIYLFTYTFIFSTIYISYMYILLCLYTESVCLHYKNEINTLCFKSLFSHSVIFRIHTPM